MYRIVYSKKSLKHVQNIKTANLEKQIKELMNVLRENPFRNPPPYEKIAGRVERILFQKDKREAQACISGV